MNEIDVNIYRIQNTRISFSGTGLIRTYCCILIQESKTWHKVLRTLY